MRSLDAHVSGFAVLPPEYYGLTSDPVPAAHTVPAKFPTVVSSDEQWREFLNAGTNDLTPMPITAPSRKPEPYVRPNRASRRARARSARRR